MSAAAVFALAKANWKAALGLAIGAALTWPVASCVAHRDGVRDGRAEMRAAFQKSLADAAVRNAATHQAAAERQLADERAIDQQEKGLRDAIRDVPDESPDAVRVRLNCERLRRTDPGAELPATCRSGR